MPEPSCCTASARHSLVLTAPGVCPLGHASTPSVPCMGTGQSHGDSITPGSPSRAQGEPQSSVPLALQQEEADTARVCSLSPASARACPRAEQAQGSEHTGYGLFAQGCPFPCNNQQV